MATEQIEEVLTGDPKPKPGLAEEHRAKLDSIVQQMVKNKESDSAIQMVVNDFKQKYSATQPTPEQPKPEPQQPAFKPMTDWLNMSQPQGYQPLVPENAVNEHNTKTAESSERIKAHLNDIDNSVKNLLYEHKKDLLGRVTSQNLAANPSEAGPVNFQAQQLAQKDKQDVYVSPVEVESFKSEMPNNPVLMRRGLEQRAKDLAKTNPAEANSLKADIYRLDRQNNPEKESKIAANIDKINKGEYDYDIVNGQLVKPEGFLGSLATGYKEKVQAYDDYGVYKSGDEKAMLDLINKRLRHDPDQAVPIAEEGWLSKPLAEMGRMAGGQPLKPIIGGAAAGIAAGPEAGVAAATAITAPEMYKLTFGATLPQNYAAIKKQHPDWSDSQVLQESVNFTHNQANIDALSGAAMGVLGAKVGLQPTGLNRGLLQKSLGSALKQVGQESVKKTLEGLGVGAVGASGQLVKNLMAQQEGLPVDMSEGLKEQLIGGLKMTVGMTLLAKFPEALNPKTYNQMLQAFKNVPKEAVEGELNNLKQAGQITEEQASNAQKEIKEHADIDNSIKPNVPESDRLKVQQKIKQRNGLDASLETEDKAYHTDTKEQIKSLNEDINRISKGEERGDLQKVVDKEHKNGNLQVFVTEVLRNASENDLKKYFKEIAEQVNAGNEESAIATFGENIVNKAKELYPKEESPESRVSVIQPGEIKHPETITIKPKEQGAVVVRDGVDKPIQVSNELIGSDVLNADLPDGYVSKSGKGVNVGKQTRYDDIYDAAQDMGIISNTTKRLFEFLKGKVKVTLSNKDGGPIEGMYTSKDSHLLVYKKNANWVAIHEAIHAAIDKLGMRKEKEFTAKLRSLGDEVKEKYNSNKKEFIKKYGDDFDSIIYQTIRNGNEEELITYFLTNEKFREFANEINVADKIHNTIPKEIRPQPQPETITIKPKENAIPIGSSEEVHVGETPGNSQEMGAGIPESGETSGTQEGQPIQEEGKGTGNEEKSIAGLSVDETYGLPFIEEPGDKRTGIKNVISKTTRFERRLPPVEVGKLGSDQEILLEGKSLVDNNVINPVDVVNRILDTKEGMQPDEAKAMQYYMHQLGQQNINLRERLAGTTNEMEQADLNGQLQQLSDEIDAATQANIISGKAWSDVGNIRQIVSDNGFNASRDLATIKDAYGGKIPKDVQSKLDKAFKERDEALNKLAKLQAEEKNKAAEDTIKKEGAPKNAKKTKEQFKNERNEIKQSISDKLKQARSGESGLTAVPLPFAKELISISPELFKLIKSYAEEGVQKTEEVINRLHDVLKDELDGITKADIVNLLAGRYKAEGENVSKVSQRIRDYRTEANLWTKIAEATKMEEETPAQKQEKNKKLQDLRDRLNDIRKKNNEAIVAAKDILDTDVQKELKKLTRQRRALETRYRTKKYLVPAEKTSTPISAEILKEKQRIVNANYKIRIEKRRAFESQKSFYQKGLMWLGRGVRLSVLSGYNVLAKLAAASTIGGAAKRIPEQAIGFIYGNAFKGVAEKAPIEGFINASAEAKFYKEFFNPKKFAQNTWEILKSGESPLSKKFSPGTYEHIPGVYLPTDLHQVIKDPLKRGVYEASLKNALVWAERNGMDINDDLVLQSLETAAYKRAQYEIFQEQNWLSKKFGEWKHNMEQAGNLGATGKFLADFMIPVSTVPTNIARRMVATSPFGLIKGSIEVVKAYREGIEKLSPEQADSVMRQLKQGTLGTALWLIGWYGYAQFGGLYSKFNPNKSRDQGDLSSDEMSVGGKMVPKPVQHALPLEIIQFAATARRVYDNYKDNKAASTPEAIEKAGLASIGALTEQIPVVETVAHTIGAFNNPYEAKKLEEDVKRRIRPQILRETGIIGEDKDKGGSTGGAGATGRTASRERPTRVHRTNPHQKH